MKISFDDYRKYSFMIVNVMKEFERQGDDNVRQGELVEKLVQKIELETEERQTSLEKAQETTRKIHSVINHLIT